MEFFLKQFVATTAMVLAAVASMANEAFPSKPIKIIATSAAGGLADVHTRTVAKYLSEKLGQNVIVENRPGAGGLVAMRSMKSMPADGYTLMAALNTSAIQQVSNIDPGYDLLKDFTGIGMMTRSPFVLITPASEPDTSLAQFISRAKANPGKLTYASAGQGSTTHLSGALFARRAGIDLTHVPYKGNSAAWPDLGAGRVNMLIEGYSTAMPMVRDGRVKVLGVTSNKRMDGLPEVPTLAEAGAPGYTFYLWLGLVAPAGTSKDVVQKLAAALRAVMALPEVRARFQAEGSEAVTMSSDDFNAFLLDEVASMGKLVTDLNLPK